jgi:hypothetical protein
VTTACCGAALQRTWEPLPLTPGLVRLLETCSGCARLVRSQLATVRDPGAERLRAQIERIDHD